MQRIGIVLLFLAGAATSYAQTTKLANGGIAASFGPRGIVSIAANSGVDVYQFRQDEFALSIDGKPFDSARHAPPLRRNSKTDVTYTWWADPFRIDVTYEVQPAWAFVSKRIAVTASAPTTFHVDSVDVFRSVLASAPTDVFVRALERQNLGLGEYGGWMRFASKDALSGHSESQGLLALAQNPFLHFTHDEASFTVRYAPDMDWDPGWGPFESDRGLLVPYRLTGRRLPARMIPEWRLAATEPEMIAATGLDVGEIDAFTSAVRAFLMHPPERPVNVFVGWCVNDYQIDIATEEGRTEYKRVIDRAAELGADHVLFAPTNSALAHREDSTDDWSWENLLWLALGQKIRRGEWDPHTGEVPASVAEMVGYAKRRGVSLLAYVYPVLAFSQNPEWLVTRPNAPAGKKYASLGFRSLQDWLIEALVAFHDRTGIGGYSFDHTFLTFSGPSRYAQWYGWRRVMETVRRRIPGIVIDGRQAYHLYGPWSWLAGTYPHPTNNDEQPESFVPFPDLSFDRVSADRERYTAYRYRNYDFAPSEIVPGFITHQTSRSDDGGDMPQHKTADRGVVLDRFRARDWDYLGWRYSLLSSIAVAGWNNVVNMIPARDLDEYRNFNEADKQWFRRWINWTDEHRELLRHARTIFGQPALGSVDGVAAVDRDHGYLFLFNPNARRLPVTISLDDSIGLQANGNYILQELYPLEGRKLGRTASGGWTRGDHVTVDMDGHSAMVIELAPLGAVREPLLFNTAGSATLSGGTLTVSGARGEAGTTQEILVVLPTSSPVDRLIVNGRELPFKRRSSSVVTTTLSFAGAPFSPAQQVGSYDPSFAGGTFRAKFSVPQRVFDQLRGREKAWPIPWTAEDYRTTWLAPERLLLYVQIAEPDDTWDARLKIDGRNVELKKAYSAVRAASGTFVGFYADVSLLTPDREYDLELVLPPLGPGQFQGVFFENVEPEYTSELK
jgi:hypothetical protein